MMTDKRRRSIGKYIRISNYAVVVVFILKILVPSIIIYNRALPPINELEVTKGKVVIQKVGYKVRTIGLDVNGDEQYFTCVSFNNEKNGQCGPLMQYDQFMEIENRQAEARWYWELKDSILRKKILVTLSVDGNELIDYEATKKLVNKFAGRVFGIAAINFIVFFVIIVLFEAYRKSMLSGIKQGN